MERNNNSAIGARIRTRRTQLGLSQTQVAHESGVSMQAISLWENGKTFPGGSNAAALAKALKCDISWLLNGREGDENTQEWDVLDEELGRVRREQARRKHMQELQNIPLSNFISDREKTDPTLTEDLYHLVQLFGDLDKNRRAELLRFAIEQWRDYTAEELKKYEELYNKLK